MRRRKTLESFELRQDAGDWRVTPQRVLELLGTTPPGHDLLGTRWSNLQGPLPVYQPLSDRIRNLLALGHLGQGKSVLLAILALQAILARRPVVFVDCATGSTIDLILRWIPPEHLPRVAVVDLALLSDYVVGIEPLQRATPPDHPLADHEKEAILSNLLHSLGLTGEDTGERWGRFLLALARAQMERTGPHIPALYRLLADADARAALARETKDPELAAYLTKISGLDSHHFEPALRRLSDIILNRSLFALVSHPPLDAPRFLAGGGVLLVRAPPAEVGETTTRLLVNTVVTQLLFFAQAVPEEKRGVLSLFIDEFAWANPVVLPRLLAASRGLGVSVNLSAHYLSQIPPGLRDAVLAHCGTLLTFNTMNLDDARAVAPRFPGVPVEKMLSLPRFTVLCRVQEGTTLGRPFELHTLPPLSPLRGSREAAALKEESLVRHGVPRVKAAPGPPRQREAAPEADLDPKVAEARGLILRRGWAGTPRLTGVGLGPAELGALAGLSGVGKHPVAPFGPKGGAATAIFYSVKMARGVPAHFCTCAALVDALESRGVRARIPEDNLQPDVVAEPGGVAVGVEVEMKNRKDEIQRLQGKIERFGQQMREGRSDIERLFLLLPSSGRRFYERSLALPAWAEIVGRGDVVERILAAGNRR